MGKPFAKELEKLSDTVIWSLGQETDALRKALINNKKPLIIVGSGGSLSACYFVALLYQQFGMMAKAVTPLELHYSQQILRESNVLFISASGRNNDIIFAYKTAVSCEPNAIISVSMKNDTPLGDLANTICNSAHFSFELPTGGDGFLATNSLVAFFGVVAKALSLDKFEYGFQDEIPTFKRYLPDFIKRIDQNYTFMVLHAGWGQPVAYDLESKLAEAALGDILVSDYRNFGHGRHHWLDKRGANACIIALITPQEKQIALKTFGFLPVEVPILFIESEKNGPAASLELLIKSFLFVEQLGRMQGIDPGRPGVPGYGSDLYHLNYQKLYLTSKKKYEQRKEIAIVRKSKSSVFHDLSKKSQEYWSTAYDEFLSNLEKAKFGSVIFDYDGTLSSAKNRFTGLDAEVVPYLVNLLSKGFILGIATGRGKSVKKALQDAIPELYWSQVLVGYYNCSEIALLGDINTPNKSLALNVKLEEIYNVLLDYKFSVEVKFDFKPSQLTIQIQDPMEWPMVRNSIIQLIMLKGLPHVQILESSHSMDIIDQGITNKLNIKSHCQALAQEKNIEKDCLFIGDKGQWPGNDYQLLSEKYSLSVDEVSTLTKNCWNLAMPGVRNIDATTYYLSCFTFKDNFLKFKLK